MVAALNRLLRTTDDALKVGSSRGPWGALYQTTKAPPCLRSTIPCPPLEVPPIRQAANRSRIAGGRSNPCLPSFATRIKAASGPLPTPVLRPRRPCTSPFRDRHRRSCPPTRPGITIESPEHPAHAAAEARLTRVPRDRHRSQPRRARSEPAGGRRNRLRTRRQPTFQARC
jgi:hypothetical protein